MSLHKLTAGDGYTYLTRQVAAHDAGSRGYASLGDYYEQKGESPGEWLGRGLSGLPDFLATGPVSEAQMRALFGEGRHPDAERIEQQMRATGATTKQILAATRLGAPFRIYEASNAFRTRVAQAFAGYNGDLGFPRDWPVPATDRARIRTEIAETMFREQYGRPPADARERSGFLARICRQATTAVAGYDVTFSPVKSVSALWAIGDRPVAEQVEAAHRAAVTDALTWLEDHAAYTRTGTDGVAQVDVTGLLAAAFTHRDSRAGDPDLHTHVAISNKVQTAADGRWRALDGRPIHKLTVAASERYNTRLEAELAARLGVGFAPRPDTEPGKRPVRELVGMDARLLAAWSKRRALIEVRRGELATGFQAEHHRPPNPVEAIALAQQATLETRQGKHPPRSLAEQRQAWAGQAREVLGGADPVHAMLTTVLSPAHGRRRRVGRRWVERTAVAVVATVQAGRATWQEAHVRAEAERAARAADLPRDQVDAVVDAVVAEALSPRHSVPLQECDPVTEPAMLRRRDGSSVYTVAGARLYTSAAILAAEQRLLRLAGRRDGRAVPATVVEVALLEQTANGVTLNAGQVQLVRELASSGARLQLALAPAGTGKTTAMRVLARAWRDGGGQVLGLAPSAAAAAVLRRELDSHTDTLAKLQHALAVHAEAGRPLPDWVARIGPDTLVVIDEAGMAATTDLAAVATYVTGRGGSVRLVGDDQQLAAIGAGGVLRDIAETHGAVSLSQVVRFTDPAEGAASLALRAGEAAAIGYYTDRGRIHVGDLATVVEQAYTAWAGDIAAGRDAVMLAPIRELVADLNARARTERLTAAGLLDDVGAEVDLADGTRAGAGDTIITRSNDRRLTFTATDWVKNGDRWQVVAVRTDGGLDVVHLGTGRAVHLPAAYVGEHVALGYATTVHGAQGVTAEVTHAVATGTEHRQLLYVALTRGRHANHLYLVVAGDGDPHTVITRDALLPPTAVDILTRILARDGAQVSATSAIRDLSDPARRLQTAADRYTHALGAAAEHVLGPDRVADLDRAGNTARPGLTDEPAWPTLRAHLALHAIAGHNPTVVLEQAITERELASALDPAAVLDWRLDPTGRRSGPAGPLPWLPGIPTTLADHPAWGDYLTARSHLVTDLAADLATTVGEWTPAGAPAWAAALIDRDLQLVVDLAVWRAGVGVPDEDTRATGPAQPAAARARHQKRLAARLVAVLGAPDVATTRWRPLAEQIEPRILADPFWPTLAARMAAAARAGVDVAALTRAVAGTRPLPDEQPAAALWWRLAHQLPAALTGSTAHGLRPAWTPALADLLGPSAANRIVADPAWPALVAAVAAATDRGWRPRHVLATAHELLSAGQDDAAPLRPEELTGALIWRVGLLADPDPVFGRDWAPTSPPPEPPEPDEPDPPEHVPTRRDADHRLPVADRSDPDEPDAWTRAEVEAIARAALAAAPTAPPPVEPSRTAGADEIVPRQRILELNALAQDFFTAAYPTSWAGAYLRRRLGDDLADDPRVTPGYAPAGWRALVGYLQLHGATATEILAAGLAIRASNGNLIDRFRDRLVLPIRTPDGIAGFVARRNPDHDHDVGGERHGPKYLNTSDTPAYTKGAHLYGLTQNADALAAGAAPVLVEGPLDAIAVTLAGDGRRVGIATLGTALTDTQADLLRPHLRTGGPGVIVATDPDPAGRQAAARAFWQLALRGGNPAVLDLPDGIDPADLYTRDPHALRAALAAPGVLAEQLISDRVAAFTDILDTVEGRVGAARAAAAVIVATPPETWPAHVDQLTTAGLPAHMTQTEILNALAAWTLDPADHAGQQARRDLALLRPNRQSADSELVPVSPVADAQPTTRWKPLADSLDRRLTQGPDWPPLAAAMDRAHRAWTDLDTLLPELIADPQLPADRPARVLRYRLIAVCSAAATPVPAPESSPGSAIGSAQSRWPAVPPTAPRRAPAAPGMSRG